jgi:hypothetical protein
MIRLSLAALAALAWSAASAADFADLPSPDAQEMPLLVSFAIVPDPTLTPGAVRTTDPVDICERGTRGLRHMTRQRSDAILSEYGLPPGPHPDVEIDHLIPLEIGGADSDANLWPEPRRTVEPKWNAEAKDRLENRLHALICAGDTMPDEAQAAFVNDWTEAYREYVSDRTDPPARGG